jgi:hypothetical protein
LYAKNVRIRHGKVSISHGIHDNAAIAYEGLPQPYEDPADYLPRNITIRGVRIA